MARHTWTLALIIICLSILATVITAFRVRDLPKALESVKAETKKKCDDCDENVFKDKRSVKIESATKRYEELKKAVKEKQQELQKAPDKNYKFVDDSADDDDDADESELLKKETVIKQKGEKDSFVKKENKEKKLIKETAIKRPIVFKIHDDDDDDDDDEDEDDIQLKSKHKSHNVDNKADTSLKGSKGKKGSKNENEDVNYESKKENLKLIKKKPESNQKSEDSNIKTEKKPNKNIDDKVVTDKITDKKQKEHDSKNKPELHDKPKDTKVKKETNKKISDIGKDDDDDDDDNDDDDDDDDSDQKDLKTKTQKKDTVTSTIQIVKSGTIEKKKKRKVNDNDDEDDEDDDDDDSEVILSKPSKKVVQPEKTAPNLKNPETKKEVLKDSKQILENSKKIEPLKKEKKVDAKQEDKKTEDKQKSVPKTDKKDEPLKKPKEVEKLKPKTESKKADPKENTEKPKESKKHEKESRNVLKKDYSVEMLLDSSEIYGKSDQIKHVSDALQRRNLLQSEFEDFYAFFPTFAPNFSRIHNPECRRHGQILLRQLRGTKLWALNMLDSTAKIPSGLLQGNGIQLGEFDQCINSRAKVQLDTGSVVKVQGQYCLARLEVKAEHEELEIPVHLAQARNLIKSRIDDPGHFVPRFSTLSWGVCLPSACDPEDAEVIIKDALKHYQHRSGLVIKVKVDEDDCHTLETDWWDEWLELPTILTLAFYSVIILLVLIATVRDFFARGKSDETSGEEGGTDEEPTESKDEEKEPEQKSTDGFLSSFSLYRSVNKLAAPSTTDEIACIHGIRGIATIALLIAHKFLPVAVMPYTNRLKITELASSPLWSWARAGWMYTDCFLLLSGALTAHRISDSDSGAPWRLFTRYLRLTPALLAIVLFYSYVWDLVSVGPMWGSLVTKNAQVCQEGWWWNILYVQNYFGFEDMCAPQTHQLALDMQLTIIGGIIVWAIQSTQIVSKVILLLLHVLAAYSRYTTTSEHRLTLLAYHGVTVSQLYRTARLSYTSVIHRSTPYLVGISLGLALRNRKEHGKIFLIFGWLISTILWCSVWWAGLDSGSITYKYSSSFAAQYSTLAPIASALAIAWVIYAVHNNSSGFISRLLCSRPLAFISRLSYALYLCQFIVFLTNAATVRTATEFTLLSLIDVQEISAILLSSIILTLTFVIPMQSLHKLFTFAPKQEPEESDKGEDNQDQKETTDVPGESTEAQEDKEVGQNHTEDVIDAPQVRSRPSLLAHREFLEEIPEVELEYEMQRDKLEGLEEILEEEEDEGEVEDEEMANHLDDDELEVIEEEGGEDFWADREEYTPRSPRRSYDIEDDGEEWEYTANGIENGRGAQYFRYSR